MLDNQLQDLEKNLPAYGRVGVGRDDGISKGEHSPIFYDESVWRMDEEDHGTFWLSDTPKVVGSKSWGNGITRICTWVRLIDKEGKGIYIYNTHWDHRSKPSREKSSALILKTIKQRKHKNEPYLLMGDLNANTDSEAVKTLLADAYLIDHGTQQAVTFNSWAAKLIDGLRIDHIFVSPHFKKAAVTVKVTVKVVSNGDPPASDHHRVVMTVEFTTAAKPLFPKDVNDPSNSPTNPCK